MVAKTQDLIKQREVVFCMLHPDPRQAHTAAAVLEGVDGILALDVPRESHLKVSYNLLQITLEGIEGLLSDRGFHLDNSLMAKLRRALYHYTEDTQRENMGCPKGESNCTAKVFISSYRRREHGCRDERPDHWRRYL